jgi:hypothetical protein
MGGRYRLDEGEGSTLTYRKAATAGVVLHMLQKFVGKAQSAPVMGDAVNAPAAATQVRSQVAGEQSQLGLE